MKKIIWFFLIIPFVFYTNCASSQLKYKEDIYTILNIKINRLSEKKIDTLFVRKKTVNSHFKEIIKQKELIPKIDNYELVKVLSNKKEINHLISQLKDTFLINFKKIKSNKVKEYIKPIEKKNERGYYVQTKEYIDDTQTPTLFIAQTLLHEAIHANLFAAVKKLNNGVTPANSDFGILYEEYRQKRNWQHNLMADKYIDLIANGLREVHSLLNDQTFIENYNDNTLWNWNDFYEEVAWQGLYGTTKGQEHINAPEYRNDVSLYLDGAKVNSTKTPKCDD